MKKTVNYCGNCPFLVFEYDDFAVGYSSSEYCNLARYLNLPDNHISAYDGFSNENKTTVQEKINMPEWCPLKTEEYSFHFKEFSAKRLEELEKVEDEIEKLDKFFDMEEHEIDEEDEEFNSNTEKYRELLIKLGELYSSEEPTFEEEFQSDIKFTIDDIKNQLSLLENAGINLQNSLKNLNSEEN